MVYLITGATGQLGSALVKTLGKNVIAADRSVIDLEKTSELQKRLKELKPSAIFNTAAYTAVDKAEEEEALAFKINAEAVGIIAEYAFENHIPLIHYSTDYVYSGSGNKPWKEDNEPSPLNAYGRSKLAGEAAIKKVAKKYKDARFLIFRTSWVYDENGKNFLNTMLRLGMEKEIISVVSDQYGAPTYAKSLAENSVKVFESAMKMNDFPSGIYNMCGSGETTWHGFAEEIFRQAEDMGISLQVRDVKEIRTSEFPAKAARPLNSRLSMEKIKTMFNITMPDWENSLKECLRYKYENN